MFNQKTTIPIAKKRKKKTKSEQIEDKFRVNEEIKADQVRLVGDNIEQGIYPLDEAMQIADNNELDLVEISPKADPPVCKVIDFSKFKYEQKKKEKELKAKTQKTVVKEIRFGPNTDDHDFNFKVKHGEKFLKDGAKVKAYVHFSGRSIIFKDRGEYLLLKFAQELEEFGKVEQMPKLEGKRMIMLMSPKSSKK